MVDANRKEVGQRIWRQLPLIIALILLWMILWGTLSWLSLISGIIVAFVITRVFYLPPVDLAGRFNAWWAFRYLTYFLWHLAVASVQVTWLAVRRGPSPRTAILEVPLRTRSDFILTMVGLTVSLIPGSLVAEVDRFGSVLYLHVLNTPTEKEIQSMRRQAARIEELLIRAVGSREELEGLR